MSVVAHHSSKQVERKFALQNLGILGSTPGPTCFDLGKHCIGVYHCCVMHVKDPGLAFILHWKNFSSTGKTQGAHLGRPTSHCLSMHMTLFENEVQLE